MIKIIFGDNKSEILVAKKRQVKDAQENNIELEKIDIDGLKPSQITQILSARNLFSDQRFIMIEVKKIDKETLNIISDITKQDNKIQVTIYITEVDKRSILYKELRSNDLALEFAIKRDYEIIDWIINYSKENGILFSKENAQYLAGKVGYDQTRLAHEVEKLSLISDECTVDLIDKYVEEGLGSSTIFNLLDKLFDSSRESKKKILNDLYNIGNKPLYVISMIAWYMNIILLIVNAPTGTDNADIAKRSGFSQYTISKAQVTAKKMPQNKIKTILGHLESADEILKTKSVNDQNILEDLIFNKI